MNVLDLSRCFVSTNGSSKKRSAFLKRARVSDKDKVKIQKRYRDPAELDV